MLTGTPLDLTPFGPLLSLLGVAYWLLALVSAALVAWLPKSVLVKASLAVFVLAAFIYPVAKGALSQDRKRDEAQAHLQAAKARFSERCKTAGEKIKRTVDEVEGVMLLKLRPKRSDGDAKDSMWPNAAFGNERSGDEYIESFLLYEWRGPGFESRRGNVNSGPTPRPGYRYADVIDPADGKRYRYTIDFEPLQGPADVGVRRHRLARAQTSAAPPRYAITFEDVVDPEDRKHWIAGSTVRVLDQQTQEVVAEQTRFLMDTGLGSTGGFRSPWDWAAGYGLTCPVTQGSLDSKTRFFVDQVLRPKQEG